MLDIKFIRDNADLIKKGARDKRNNIDIDDTEDNTSNINYENNFEPSTTNDLFYDAVDAINEARAIQGGVGKTIRIENEVFITSQDIEYKFRGDELSFLSLTEYTCLINRKKKKKNKILVVMMMMKITTLMKIIIKNQM